jgi:hypothetical protein
MDSGVEVITDIHHDVLGDVAHHVLMNVEEDTFHNYKEQQESANGGHYCEFVRFTDPGKIVNQRPQLIL